MPRTRAWLCSSFGQHLEDKSEVYTVLSVPCTLGISVLYEGVVNVASKGRPHRGSFKALSVLSFGCLALVLWLFGFPWWFR